MLKLFYKDGLNVYFQENLLQRIVFIYGIIYLLGEAIRRTHNNESINDLFNHE